MCNLATVIIVAYHADEWLPRCVDSLRESLREPVRLLLVDNAGNSCLRSLDLAGLDAVVLRCQRPLGFAEANNFALQTIDFRTPAVCFLNQDTISNPGWLDACLACLDAHPEIGAVMPLMRTYDNGGWDQPFLECARRSDRFVRHLAAGEPFEDCYRVPDITAAAMVARTEALVKAGPFDPIFGSYYEDYDLCRRIREQGYELAICGTAQVRHFSGSATSTEEARRRRMRLLLRNRCVHYLRCAGTRRIRAGLHYAWGSFLYNLARSLCRTRSSQALSVYLGAHRDLWALRRRLLSERRDRDAWVKYLEGMGWPNGFDRHEPEKCPSLEISS